MFRLFHRKEKKELKTEVPAKHDEYEVYRMMSPEDLEAEAQSKETEANEIVKKWDSLSEAEKSENMDLYYKCWNLRREAKFLRELKSNPNEKAPELFELISDKEYRKVQPFDW